MNSFTKYFKAYIFILLFIFSIPTTALSAEILQVESSSVLQIGDKNRTYKVKIYGINVEPSKDKEAISWLRSNLPRKTKVNLLPKGFEDEELISEVIKLKTDEDIASQMIKLGFGGENRDL